MVFKPNEALDDWTLTVVLYIGTYLGANHISIWKHGITDTVTKEKVTDDRYTYFLVVKPFVGE